MLPELRAHGDFREALEKLVLPDQLGLPVAGDPADPLERMATGAQSAQKDHRVQAVLLVQKDRKESQEPQEPQEPRAQAVLLGQHLQSR